VQVVVESTIYVEVALEIPAPAAEAIVRYREKNGDIKSLDELKKVPAVDAAKVESKKDLLVF
jgi:competence protein ComEA